METKNIIALEVEKEDRVYRFQIPANAPLAEAYDAATQFLTEMVRMINEHAEKQMPKAENVQAENVQAEEVQVEEVSQEK